MFLKTRIAGFKGRIFAPVALSNYVIATLFTESINNRKPAAARYVKRFLAPECLVIIIDRIR